MIFGFDISILNYSVFGLLFGKKQGIRLLFALKTFFGIRSCLTIGDQKKFCHKYGQYGYQKLCLDLTKWELKTRIQQNHRPEKMAKKWWKQWKIKIWLFLTHFDNFLKPGGLYWILVFCSYLVRSRHNFWYPYCPYLWQKLFWSPMVPPLNFHGAKITEQPSRDVLEKK